MEAAASGVQGLVVSLPLTKPLACPVGKLLLLQRVAAEMTRGDTTQVLSAQSDAQETSAPVLLVAAAVPGLRLMERGRVWRLRPASSKHGGFGRLSSLFLASSCRVRGAEPQAGRQLASAGLRFGLPRRRWGSAALCWPPASRQALCGTFHVHRYGGWLSLLK